MTNNERGAFSAPIKDIVASYQQEKLTGHFAVWGTAYEAAAEHFGISSRSSFEAIGYAMEDITTQRALSKGTNRRGAVLFGTPASGKTSVKKQLVENNFQQLLTYVSREPREGEEDGVDYHFITHEQMLQRADDGELYMLPGLPGRQSRIAQNKKTIASYLQENTPFVTNQELQDWGKIEHEVMNMGVTQKDMDRALLVYILPPSPTVLFERSLERVAKGEKNPPGIPQWQPASTEIIFNELERSFAGTGDLLDSLNNDRIVYVVNDDLDRVTEKVLTLTGMRQSI